MNIESDGPEQSYADTRPGWHKWAMGIAEAVAERADCSRRKVGAVIVDADRRIVATGYNGAPAGRAGCLTLGACPRASSDAVSLQSSYSEGETRCIALHAEANALLRASWEEMKGSTLYVTCEPCYQCQTLIAGTPLAAVVWKNTDETYSMKHLR